jgi:hypothetical protein
MKSFRNFVTFGVLLSISAEVSGYFSESPLNTMSLKDLPVSLRCSSQSATPASNMHWDFKPYTGSENTTSTRRVVTGCVSLTQDYTTNTISPGQCHLTVTSLQAYHAGRYTCVNGNESAAAQLGTIVLQPSCAVNPSGPVVEGQPIDLYCVIQYAGNFSLNLQSSSINMQSSTSSSTYVNKTVYDADPKQVYAVYELYITANLTAPRPKVARYTQGVAFKAALPDVPMGNATNEPSYKFVWDSNSLSVLYAPKDNEINITGDCRTKLPVGSVITCSAWGNPSPTYTWTDPSGKTIQGPNLTLTTAGDRMVYKCKAENSVGNGTKTCSMDITGSSSTAMTLQVNGCLILGLIVFMTSLLQ